jgi:hypothetical protein
LSIALPPTCLLSDACKTSGVYVRDTDLPDEHSRLSDFADANTRIRLEGTHNLLAAAAAANMGGFLAQSIARKLTDDRQKSLDEFEQMLLSAGCVVLGGTVTTLTLIGR